MKKIILTTMLLISVSLFSQTTKKGYIIEIEGSNVFVDFTSKDVKVGERLKVISDPREIIHPVTKEKIIKDGDLIATLEITETHSNYSVASRVYPTNALSKLTVGAKVYLPNDSTINIAMIPKDGKVNVAIGAATINDMVGPGYFGNYVSDMLMGDLLDCDKIRLIDRSLLSAQVNEVDLKGADYVNSDNAIMKGQIAGVQYMIQVTMQKPDVTNITTGTPVNSILNAVSSVSQIVGAPGALSKGLEIGANLTSNVNTSTLRSKVSITARVVDVQTGEVLFMCSGTGNAQGEMQAELEGGALGGMQINGGVDGFKQTITGKAVAITYRKIGNSLKDFFNGATKEKVVNSGAITELTYRKGQIYQGVNKLPNYEIKDLYSDTPNLYFDYKKGKNIITYGTLLESIGGIGLVFLFVDSYGLDNVGWGGSDAKGLLLFTYPSKPLFGVYCVSSLAIGITGYLIQKQGRIKIKKGINVYNQSLHQSQFLPEYHIGLSPEGLALTLNF